MGVIFNRRKFFLFHILSKITRKHNFYEAESMRKSSHFNNRNLSNSLFSFIPVRSLTLHTVPVRSLNTIPDNIDTGVLDILNSKTNVIGACCTALYQ